jgi:hypothetical protein
MSTLAIALMIEAAVIEAIKSGAEYSSIWFEDDGSITAQVCTERGYFWMTR